MLRSVNSMTGYRIMALDGEIGQCKDFLFDDQFWTIRYIVVNTGNWLTGKKVLVSPVSISGADWKNRQFNVNLSKEQIENAPSLDEDAPVSRQYEIQWAEYHKISPYWAGPYMWGGYHFPYGNLELDMRSEVQAARDGDQSKDLRSANEVVGYTISSSDGAVGPVEDFVLDEENWSLRYMVVNTGTWLTGRKVLVSHLWIEFISWSDREVSVNMTRKQIKDSPQYNPAAAVNREYEERLYDYYGRPKYWR